MFSTKGPVSPLWKSLAIEFQGSIIFAQVRDTQKKVVEEFNVQKFPTLILLPGGSAPGIVYSGEMKPERLLEFLADRAPEPTPDAPPVKPKPKPQDTEGTIPRNNTNVSLHCEEDHRHRRSRPEMFQNLWCMLSIPRSG